MRTFLPEPVTPVTPVTNGLFYEGESCNGLGSECNGLKHIFFVYSSGFYRYAKFSSKNSILTRYKIGLKNLTRYARFRHFHTHQQWSAKLARNRRRKRGLND